MAKVYIEQILKIKTGLFFNEMLELCDDLSVAFQIWDDLMNLRPSTVSKNKNKIGEVSHRILEARSRHHTPGGA